ncbi:MAG: bifunctional 4-hydroxy-2-oxoglutarate aldolase/2-dehydro-3-deoxy-phosphogluconate aldolase [Prochlorococcus sp.]|jgi:2-dehydro-3-deoxyphosphogluconate aldolase/(4S)-4-hydroxy-2-oxoglutarate aldolase
MASLRVQPFVVVLRPEDDDLELSSPRSTLFAMLEQLHVAGVRHVELAWSAHPGWMSLIRLVQDCFADFCLGAASISSPEALQSVAELGLAYAMTPFWDPVLDEKARQMQQVLVPGLFSPTEIQQACRCGSRLVKLFPASVLGIDYWSQLAGPMNDLPFVIAAGGLTVSDLNPWLDAGYDAIALGRGLVRQGKLDPALQVYLKTSTSAD